MIDSLHDAAIIAALADTAKPIEAARTLPRAVYSAEHVFTLEQRAITATMWLAVAREEDLPEIGSYLTCDVAGERMLILRGEDRVPRAFFNICRHRGARLVDEPIGQLRGVLTCPYHAWTYHLDGKLARAPRAAPEFRTEEYALVAARLDTFAGFIFINLEPNAPPLARQLDALPDLSRYEMSKLRRTRRIEYDVNANWKIICENYSECYHCPTVHPQLNRISDLTSGTFESGAGFNGGPMRLREGFNTMSRTGVTSRSPMPALTSDDLRLVHYYLLYPSFMLGLHPDYVLTHTVWPLSVSTSRVVCEFFFRPEVSGAPGFDPADALEFWDLTNRQDWALCERVQRGASSRGYRPGPYHATERCVHAFDQWYAERLLAL